jgi:hypothetical protein
VPRLAGKTDLIPNHPNRMWMDPHETGLYLGQCAQYCGVQHAMMLLARLCRDTRGDFDRWIENQSQPAQVNGGSEGQKIFESTACVNCHTVREPRQLGASVPIYPSDEPRHHRFRRREEHTKTAPWIQNPDALNPGSKMPAMGLSDPQLGAVTSHTWRLFADVDRIHRIGWSGAEDANLSSWSSFTWVTTVDHKRLGILYIFYALLFLVIGGIEATIMRIQLIRPLNNFVSPQVFNRMFTMHGTTMIFFVAMPLVFGFANYLVP